MIRLYNYVKNYGNYTKSEVIKLNNDKKILVNNELKNISYIIRNGDEVKVCGNIIKEIPNVYYLYYKPRGIICSNVSTLTNGLKNNINIKERIFSVGRLDKDSEGLLILTNDGYLKEELLSEKNHIEKEYLVITKEKIDNQFIKNIQESIEIKGKITKKAKAQFVDDYTFKIILEEGKYHQIRKLVQRESNKVVTLKRIRIGKIKIDNLKESEILKVEDIRKLL